MRLRLAVFLAVLLAGGGAQAQEAEAGADGRYNLRISGDILFEAEELVYDRPRRRVEARGRVEIAQGGRLLTADYASYDERSGVIRVEGNVQFFEPGRAVLSARRAVFQRDLESGRISWPALRWGDESRLAARAARRGGRENVLLNAVYSPCRLCPEEGRTRPVWQIRAQRVTYDQDSRTVEYRGAVMEILGVPVFYLPYLWHPSPEVKRKSGFLIPDASRSGNLGFRFSLPYFATLGRRADLIVEPVITSRKGVVFEGGLRHVVGNGYYALSGSATWPAERAAGEPSFRGHLFGRGRFRLGLHGRWGFDIQAASDDTYLRFYDLSEETSLISRLFVEATGEEHRLSLIGYYFKDLLVEEEETPSVGPYFDYIGSPAARLFGGSLSFRINALSLLREGRGRDQRRLSLATAWERTFVDPWGGALQLFARMRGDLYHIEETPPGMTRAESRLETRLLPLAGAVWQWPLIRHGRDTSQIIKPVVQLVYSGNSASDTRIPIEDGPIAELDDSNLLSRNRFDGFDQWESGLRVDAALSLSLQGQAGGLLDFLAGQSFRLRHDSASDPVRGAAGDSSDYIARIILSPAENIELTQRLRLDRSTFDLRRNEVDFLFTSHLGSFFVGYVNIEEGAGPVPEAREEIHAGGALRPFENLKLYGEFRRSLEDNRSVHSRFGLRYADECLILDLSLEQDFTRDREIDPDTRIGLRISFRTLGSGRLSALLDSRARGLDFLSRRQGFRGGP